MSPAAARHRFTASRVARLASVAADGRPHIVPITFALLDADTLVTAVDQKPKRTRALHRLANIAANPAVAVLVDGYSDDWNELWWARADGTAAVLAADARPDALDALAARYGQYRERRPAGPVIIMAVERWSGWTASGGG